MKVQTLTKYIFHLTDTAFNTIFQLSQFKKNMFKTNMFCTKQKKTAATYFSLGLSIDVAK